MKYDKKYHNLKELFNEKLSETDNNYPSKSLTEYTYMQTEIYKDSKEDSRIDYITDLLEQILYCFKIITAYVIIQLTILSFKAITKIATGITIFETLKALFK